MNEEGFWDASRCHAARLGRGVVGTALRLFNAIKSPHTPLWAKLTATASLGYLIVPTDVIPDFLPGVGLLDDMAAIGSAWTLILQAIARPEVEAESEQTLAEWFGPSETPTPPDPSSAPPLPDPSRVE